MVVSGDSPSHKGRIIDYVSGQCQGRDTVLGPLRPELPKRSALAPRRAGHGLQVTKLLTSPSSPGYLRLGHTIVPPGTILVLVSI